MLNLLPLTQHGRNLIVAPNALLNTQITEALRTRNIPVFSSALTSPVLALSMFMMCKAQTAALVTTCPRMIGGTWNARGFDRLIFIGDATMTRGRADRLIHAYHRHVPDAACYAFNDEGELYSPAESRSAVLMQPPSPGKSVPMSKVVDLLCGDELEPGDVMRLVEGKVSA